MEIGMRIEDFSGKFDALFRSTRMKNYLSPLELAALADENLIVVNRTTLMDWLVEVEVPFGSLSPVDVEIIDEAVRLVQVCRNTP